MTKYLNTKYGIEILHDDGTTQILAGEGDPSIIGMDAGIGSIFMRSDNGGGLFTKIGETSTAWKQLPTSTTNNVVNTHDSYVEYEREHGRIVSITEWENVTKVKKISSTIIIRLNNKVASTITRMYDYTTGTEVITTVTETIYRENNKVKTISTELGI